MTSSATLLSSSSSTPPPFHRKDQSLATLPPVASFLIRRLSESTLMPQNVPVTCADNARNRKTHVECSAMSDEDIYSSSSSMIDALHDDEWLRLVFKEFDENGDGMISKEEMGKQFEKVLGMASTHLSLSLILDEFFLNEEEFIRVYHSSSQDVSEEMEEQYDIDEEEEIAQVFKVFDKNGDGLISAGELQSVLCSLGFPQGRDLSACQDMIRRVDGDGNGHIDFLEFKLMMRLPLSISSFPAH